MLRAATLLCRWVTQAFAMVLFLLLLGLASGLLQISISSAPPAGAQTAQEAVAREAGVQTRSPADIALSWDARQRAEWEQYIQWCDDLLWSKNLEYVQDLDWMREIRYRAGKVLMTEQSLRWNKQHCEKMVAWDWCRKFPDSQRCTPPAGGVSK